jgi:hypothetical protein
MHHTVRARDGFDFNTDECIPRERSGARSGRSVTPLVQYGAGSLGKLGALLLKLLG